MKSIKYSKVSVNDDITNGGKLEVTESHLKSSKCKKYIGIMSGWIAMILAILSGAGSGPMFKYMEDSGIKPALAASWRCQCMSVFLIPLAVIEMMKKREYIMFLERRANLQYQIYVHVLIAGFAWSATLLFWINGLEFTTTVRASLVVNLHPLLLVIYLYFCGNSIQLYDWVGVILSISGVAIIGANKLFDTNNDEEPSRGWSELFGVGLLFIAATSEFIVILNRKQIKKYVPLMQVMRVYVIRNHIYCYTFLFCIYVTNDYVYK